MPYWRLSVQKFVADYVIDMSGLDLNNVSVLELGCGLGYMLARLSCLLPRNAKLVGIDINSEAISRAEGLLKEAGGRAKTLLRRVNAENMTFGDQEFDIVVANLAFSVFERPGKVASEVFRILKPGGRVIVSEVSSLSVLGKVGQLLDAASGHLHYDLFSPGSLANLFLRHGLVTIETTRVPLRTRILKHDLRIPARFSPVLLIELSKPSLLYQGRRDK
jgi:SAM-dependent methyltransferase